MEKIYNVLLDTKDDVKNPAFVVNTNDLKTVKINVLINQDGDPIDLTGATVRLAVKKPDKTTVLQDITVVDAVAGSCAIVLNTQAYVIDGKYDAEVMVYYGVDTVAVTGKFSYKAVKGILDDGTVESTNEWQSITQAIADNAALLNELQTTGTGVDAQARADIASHTSQLVEKANKVDFKKFNFADYNPSYITELSLKADQYTQGTFQKGNYLYTCQSDGLTQEGYILTRTDLAGNFVDSMNVLNGGHGTGIGIEDVSGTIYIWSQMYNASTYKLCRFPYTPDTTVNGTEGSTVYYNAFTTQYNYPIVDQDNDRILIMRYPNGSGSGQGMVVEVRKLSDVKVGTNSILFSYTLNSDQATAHQAFAYSHPNLYILLGHPISETGTRYGIDCVDVTNGLTVSNYAKYIGELADGSYSNNYAEMEGMFVYTDPVTGDKGLFVVVNTGSNYSNVRINALLYAFAPKSIKDRFTGYVMRNMPKTSLLDRDGRAKWLNMSQVTSLDSLLTPNYYYVSNSYFPTLNDPILNKYNMNSDAFLSIKSYKGTNTISVQTLEYYSSATPVILSRVIDSIGGKSDWVSISNARVTLNEGVDIMTLPAGMYEGFNCTNIPITGDGSIYEFDVSVAKSGRKQYRAVNSANGRTFSKTVHTNGTGGSATGTGLGTGWREVSFLA